MQFFRTKRLVIAGATALSVALGAVVVVGASGAGQVYAQTADTDLDGVVEAMPASGMIGTWQVAGKTVQVNEATTFDQEMGPLAVGVSVEVEGTAQADGTILASDIEVTDNR